MGNGVGVIEVNGKTNGEVWVRERWRKCRSSLPASVLCSLFPHRAPNKSLILITYILCLHCTSCCLSTLSQVVDYCQCYQKGAENSWFSITSTFRPLPLTQLAAFNIIILWYTVIHFFLSIIIVHHVTYILTFSDVQMIVIKSHPMSLFYRTYKPGTGAVKVCMHVRTVKGLFNKWEIMRRLSSSEVGTKANFLSACHLLCQSTLEDWTCQSKLKTACCRCTRQWEQPFLGLTLWRGFQGLLRKSNSDTKHNNMWHIIFTAPQGCRVFNAFKTNYFWAQDLKLKRRNVRYKDKFMLSLGKE